MMALTENRDMPGAMIAGSDELSEFRFLLQALEFGARRRNPQKVVRRVICLRLKRACASIAAVPFRRHPRKPPYPLRVMLPGAYTHMAGYLDYLMMCNLLSTTCTDSA